MLSETMRQLAIIEVPGNIGPVTVNRQYNGMIEVAYMNDNQLAHPAFDSYASALRAVLDLVEAAESSDDAVGVDAAGAVRTPV